MKLASRCKARTHRTTSDLTYLQSGGFYSAEDADSLPTHESTEKREGAFCVWTHNDVSAALPDSVFADSNLQESDVFCYHYTVRQSGNVDPFQASFTKTNLFFVVTITRNDAQSSRHRYPGKTF